MPSSVTRPMGVAASSHFVAIAWTWSTRSAFATTSIRSCDSDSRISYGVIPGSRVGTSDRSEEHTSELQSQSNLVCRLLLEKKKTKHLTTTEADTSDAPNQLLYGWRLKNIKKCRQDIGELSLHTPINT